jgi:hypothetical protein
VSDDVLVQIEADGQPTVQLRIDPPPIVKFTVSEVQQVESGDAIRVVGDVVHVDIDRLSLAP